MEGILTEILQLMTSGITTLGTGIGDGMNSFITSAFIDQSAEAMKLTVLGGLVAIFAGIGLATGLTQKIFHFFCSFGRH